MSAVSGFSDDDFFRPLEDKDGHGPPAGSKVNTILASFSNSFRFQSKYDLTQADLDAASMDADPDRRSLRSVNAAAPDKSQLMEQRSAYCSSLRVKLREAPLGEDPIKHLLEQLDDSAPRDEDWFSSPLSSDRKKQMLSRLRARLRDVPADRNPVEVVLALLDGALPAAAAGASRSADVQRQSVFASISPYDEEQSEADNFGLAWQPDDDSQAADSGHDGANTQRSAAASALAEFLPADLTSPSRRRD
jgi:hypothetical protein